MVRARLQPSPQPNCPALPTAAPLCPVRAFTPAFVASQVYAMTCDELWDHMAKFEEKGGAAAGGKKDVAVRQEEQPTCRAIGRAVHGAYSHDSATSR